MDKNKKPFNIIETLLQTTQNTIGVLKMLQLIKSGATTKGTYAI